MCFQKRGLAIASCRNLLKIAASRLEARPPNPCYPLQSLISPRCHERQRPSVPSWNTPGLSVSTACSFTVPLPAQSCPQAARCHSFLTVPLPHKWDALSQVFVEMSQITMLISGMLAGAQPGLVPRLLDPASALQLPQGCVETHSTSTSGQSRRLWGQRHILEFVNF